MVCMLCACGVCACGMCLWHVCNVCVWCVVCVCYVLDQVCDLGSYVIELEQ